MKRFVLADHLYRFQLKSSDVLVGDGGTGEVFLCTFFARATIVQMWVTCQMRSELYSQKSVQCQMFIADSKKFSS